MNPYEPAIFAIIFAVALVLFLRRVYQLFALLLLGKGENRFDRLWTRFRGMLTYGFGQIKVVEAPFGMNHFVLFWGFVILFLVNVEFLISGVFPRFSLNFIGFTPYELLHGTADIMALVVLCTVIVALLRRTFFRPPYIDPTVDSFLILVAVGLLMAVYFGANATEICAGRKTGASMPVSSAISRLITGMSDTASLCLYARAFWWIHALIFLAFLDYIPWSKHLHILASLPNCFFRRFSFPAALSRMIFRKGERFGVSKVVHFTWKDLLDFLSCSECGRCQAACPAYDTGKTLNPKRIILQGKRNLFSNGAKILASRPFDTIGQAPDNIDPAVPLIGEGSAGISPQAIWECTTCGACVEQCPILIEQFPKLLFLRRHLVMEKVEFPEEILPFFENMEQRSNPWGIAPSDRGRWAADLDIPRFSKNGTLDYLFYVGCVGSFDARMRRVCLSVVNLLRKAGLSFGILADQERCCGETVRRLGNEYVFEQMAKENMILFKRLGVRKIITLCPHCFNTFAHDYQAYGAEFEVFHHTQVIDMLLTQGSIKVEKKFNEKRIVLHDSCYLGRYNGIYEEPRRLIKAASGREPFEMARRRNRSFCCGAGGGRMWMEERSKTKINVARTREALRTSPSIIATSCPYCLTMFEDGLKDEHAQDRTQVLDVSELIDTCASQT